MWHKYVLDFLEEELQVIRHCLKIKKRVPEKLKEYSGWW